MNRLAVLCTKWYVRTKSVARSNPTMFFGAVLLLPLFAPMYDLGDVITELGEYAVAAAALGALGVGVWQILQGEYLKGIAYAILIFVGVLFCIAAYYDATSGYSLGTTVLDMVKSLFRAGS